jgi:hypothetical protein
LAVVVVAPLGVEHHLLAHLHLQLVAQVVQIIALLAVLAARVVVAILTFRVVLAARVVVVLVIAHRAQAAVLAALGVTLVLRFLAAAIAHIDKFLQVALAYWAVLVV